MDNDIILSDPERLKELHEAYVSIIHQLPEYTDNDINEKWYRYNELKKKSKLNDDETKELDLLTLLFYPINDIITSDNVTLYNRFKRNLEKIKKIFYVNTIILEIISYILELTNGNKNKLIEVIDHIDKNIKDNYSNYYEFEFLEENNKKDKDNDNNEYYDNLIDEIEKAYEKLKEKPDDKIKKRVLNKIDIEIKDEYTPDEYKIKFKHLKEKFLRLKHEEVSKSLPSVPLEDESLPSIPLEDEVDESLPSVPSSNEVDESLPSLPSEDEDYSEDNNEDIDHEYTNLIFEINELINNYDISDDDISNKIYDLRSKIKSFKTIENDDDKLTEINEYDDDLNTLKSIDKFLNSQEGDDIDLDTDKVEKFIEKYIDNMTNSDTKKELDQINDYLKSDQDQAEQKGGKCKINAIIINEIIFYVQLNFDKLINIESVVKSKDQNLASIKSYLNEYDKNSIILKNNVNIIDKCDNYSEDLLIKKKFLEKVNNFINILKNYRIYYVEIYKKIKKNKTSNYKNKEKIDHDIEDITLYEKEIDDIKILANKLINNIEIRKDPIKSAIAKIENIYPTNIYETILDEYDSEKIISENAANEKFIKEVKVHNLDPEDKLKLTIYDKIIFIIISFLIRYLNLYIIKLLINNDTINNISFAIICYSIIYILLIILCVLIVNFDTYRFRIIFNYFNLHGNTYGIIAHIIIFLVFIYLIYLLVNTISPPAINNNAQLTLSDKLKIITQLDMITILIFIFSTIIIIVI